MKNMKSITVVINKDDDIDIDYVFVIKGVDIDKVSFDKFNVDCRHEIIQAWEEEHHADLSKMEILLQDKISTITLLANANAVEKAVENAGKIVKDIVIARPPKAKKVKLTGIKLFDYA